MRMMLIDLRGDLIGFEVQCPCHRARFDLRFELLIKEFSGATA
jgi:hypothetical protein